MYKSVTSTADGMILKPLLRLVSMVDAPGDYRLLCLSDERWRRGGAVVSLPFGEKMLCCVLRFRKFVRKNAPSVGVRWGRETLYIRGSNRVCGMGGKRTICSAIGCLNSGNTWRCRLGLVRAIGLLNGHLFEAEVCLATLGDDL